MAQNGPQRPVTTKRYENTRLAYEYSMELPSWCGTRVFFPPLRSGKNTLVPHHEGSQQTLVMGDVGIFYGNGFTVSYTPVPENVGISYPRSREGG